MDGNLKVIYASEKFSLKREHRKLLLLFSSISGEYQAAILQNEKFEYSVALLSEGKLVESWGMPGNIDIFLAWRATEVLRRMKQYSPTMTHDAYLSVIRDGQVPRSVSFVVAAIGEDAVNEIMRAPVPDEILRLSYTTYPEELRSRDIRDIYLREIRAKTFTPMKQIASPQAIPPLASESMLHVPSRDEVAVESYREYLEHYYTRRFLLSDMRGRAMIEHELRMLIAKGVYVSCQQCPEMLIALAAVRAVLKVHMDAFSSLGMSVRDTLIIYVDTWGFSKLREGALRSAAEWTAEFDQSKPWFGGMFTTASAFRRMVCEKRLNLLVSLYERAYNPDKESKASSPRESRLLAS